ncbi:MAG: tetratricopeptide repeat protein [Spirochaetales bacterium]
MAGIATASELFEQGTDAFLYNRPDEAAQIFERVLDTEPSNGDAYLYLAMSYEQLQMHEKAVTTLRRAESVPGIDRGTVRFNIGNNLLKLGQVQDAVSAYGSAIDLDPFGHAAFLNRANAYVQMTEYDAALSDYRTVLRLEPEHQQRPRIERMIALLEREIDAARIAAEEERRRAEEAERRREQMLNSVLDSIKSATEDTENMSAGNEEIDTYDDEFDIADD